MSLEQVMAENNTLLRELIDLQKAGGSKSTNTGTEKTTGGAKNTKTTGGAKNTKPKAEVVDPDTLKAKLVEFKNLTDLKIAKALVKDLGFDAIADVPDDKSKEVYDSIQSAIEELDSGNEAETGEEESL